MATKAPTSNLSMLAIAELEAKLAAGKATAENALPSWPRTGCRCLSPPKSGDEGKAVRFHRLPVTWLKYITAAGVAVARQKSYGQRSA